MGKGGWECTYTEMKVQGGGLRTGRGGEGREWYRGIGANFTSIRTAFLTVA